MPRALNALRLLHQDHQQVRALLRRLERAEKEDEQRTLCEQVVDELRTHTRIEEEVLYPYLREATAREDLFQVASIEHETAKELLEQLPKEELGSPRFKAVVRVLSDYVEHHVQEEESEIFPQIEESGVDLLALGEALQQSRDGTLETSAPDGEDDDDIERRDGATARGNGAANGKSGSNGSNGAELADGDVMAANPSPEDDERFVREHEDELSRSTQHALWIHAPDEQAERDGQTLATRSLDVIRAWADVRGARPATTPGGDTERPRVLRLDFPGYDDGLQEVSWDAWGSTFQERDLVFLFQDTKADGRQSNFFRLDSPEREDG